MLRFIRRQPQTLVGIDLGAHNTKILVLDPQTWDPAALGPQNRIHSPKIQHLEIIPSAQLESEKTLAQVLVQALTQAPSSFADRLRSLLKMKNLFKLKVKKPKAAIALNTADLFMRTLSLPAAFDDEDILSHIEYEAPHLLPFPLEKLYFDFIKKTETKEEKNMQNSQNTQDTVRILLVAALKKVVDEKIENCAKLGYEVVAVESESAALERGELQCNSTLGEGGSNPIKDLEPCRIALGLALRLWIEPQAINLLPWRDRLRNTNNKIFYSQLAAFSLFSMIAVFGGHFGLLLLERQQQQKIKKIDLAMTHQAEVLEELKKYQEEKQAFEKRLQFLKTQGIDQVKLYQVLVKLMSCVPSGIALSTVTAKRPHLSLEGKAQTNGHISQLLHHLNQEKLPGIEGDWQLEVFRDKKTKDLSFKLFSGLGQTIDK